MKSSVVSGENRGSVNEILLKALQSGDKYGYEINKEIETKSGGKFFLKEASLYSGLKRLEAAGFITSYWQDGELGIRRHYYSISEKGLEKLNASNFTWDSSKEFLGEMFKNEKIEDIKTQNAQQSFFEQKSSVLNNVNSPINSQIPAEKETSDQNEVKKNPFQIEVNPLQQSFFDNFQTIETENKITNEEKNENKVEINNASFLNNSSENVNPINENLSSENKVQKNVLEEAKDLNLKDENENKEEFATIKNENESAEKLANNNILNSNLNIENTEYEKDKTEKSEENSYEKMISAYNGNDYSSSLEKENVIDISKLLNKDKINENSIVFNDLKQPLPEKEDKSLSIENNNFISNNEIRLNETNQNVQNNVNYNNQIIENKTLETTENLSDNLKRDEEKNEANQSVSSSSEFQENKVDLKNIFGSLLVGNSENNENKVEQNNLIQNEEKIEEEPIKNIEEEPKPELPRINVDNDVNVMLKSEKNNHKYEYDYTSNNIKDRSYEDKIVQTPGRNVPSVKQYINNVHKQTLISRATTITEEVNLEGINIREYSKMNNKLIRNSNYIYSNKLNFVLSLIFGILLLTESIISLIVINKTSFLSVFEIIFFCACCLTSLVIIYLYSYKYIKDKFKVDLKNYNFKSALFYFCLIFIVGLILILCVNIFSGMNSNNSFDFIIKIVLESVVSLNLIFYPVLKLCLYKLRFFSN